MGLCAAVGLPRMTTSRPYAVVEPIIPRPISPSPPSSTAYTPASQRCPSVSRDANGHPERAKHPESSPDPWTFRDESNQLISIFSRLSSENQLELDLSGLHVSDDAGEQSKTPQPLSTSQTLTPRPRRTLGELTNSLPPEVLSEIFFCHVCHHWRTVALASPCLWTYAKVVVIQRALPPALELMTRYLEHSGTLPVFIDIDFRDNWMYLNPLDALFEEIVRTARRHRPAHLIKESFTATHLQASSTKSLPSRKEWYFWSAYAAAEPTTPPNVLPASGPGSYIQPDNSKSEPSSGIVPEPSITIRASRVANGPFVLEPYLHWASSLTVLVLTDRNGYTELTTHDIARALSAFPLLVHCDVHIDLENGVALPEVTLAHVKSISLSWADWVDTGPLLDVLTTPELQELSLSGRAPNTEHGDRWDHLAHFLERNQPPLVSLILEDFDCFYSALVPCLAFVPELEQLWLEDCLLDETIIRELPFQKLKTLVLLTCYAFDIEELALLLRDNERAAANDGDNARPLIQVYVNGCGELSPTQLRIIEEMGVSYLEIGPASMPIDLNDSEMISEVN
ncbi:hypothetical protein DFH11DRAFT_1727145 [Phellopilus nigrolimitatus]|nr:hypothetical protein DFH11DRAFT_1727145 [Phellopilus nigrolimitatus]